MWPEDRRTDAPDPTSPASLPSEFPIFPLARALLLPRGRLPLNIFEPRYLNMVDAALAGGRMFGMIQPRGRSGDLERVGCLGRLSSFAETDDGCYLITLTGIARFSVREELPLRRGYRSVRADFSGFPDLRAAAPVALEREALLGLLRRYFGARGLDANWGALAQLDDDMLITTLSMVCPFSDSEKQALLEAVDQAERLDKLLALLAIGSHEGDGGTRHAS